MITSYDQIRLSLSPIYLSTAKEAFDSVYTKFAIYIWQGKYDRTVITKQENIDLYIEFIPGTDTLSVDIAPYISGFLQSTSKYYFGDPLGTPSNDVCYFYYIENQLNAAGTIVAAHTSDTEAATLGYNWRYEGIDGTYNINNGAEGFQNIVTDLYWMQGVQYFSNIINLSVDNSVDMVSKLPVVGGMTSYLTCTEEPYLIVYRNKLGLWAQFTPFGKVLVSSDISDNVYVRKYQNYQDQYSYLNHNTVRNNIRVDDTYTINTGKLDVKMVDVIEELLYSDSVYLIQYKPLTNGEYPLTIDSTIITIDNTDITIDMTHTDFYYSVFNQIPVIVTDTNFVRKNNYNDKGHINYTIRLKAASQKIIR